MGRHIHGDFFVGPKDLSVIKFIVYKAHARTPENLERGITEFLDNIASGNIHKISVCFESTKATEGILPSTYKYRVEFAPEEVEMLDARHSPSDNAIFYLNGWNDVLTSQRGGSNPSARYMAHKVMQDYLTLLPEGYHALQGSAEAKSTSTVLPIQRGAPLQMRSQLHVTHTVFGRHSTLLESEEFATYVTYEPYL